MKCKCGKETELKEFRTFSYHYCSTCKEEVKSDLSPNTPPPQVPKKTDNSGVDEDGEPLNGVYMF